MLCSHFCNILTLHMPSKCKICGVFCPSRNTYISPLLVSRGEDWCILKMYLVAICVLCIPSIYSPISPVFSSFTRSKKSLRDFVGTVTQSLTCCNTILYHKPLNWRMVTSQGVGTDYYHLVCSSTKVYILNLERKKLLTANRHRLSLLSTSESTTTLPHPLKSHIIFYTWGSVTHHGHMAK